jgi:hypothetical protein
MNWKHVPRENFLRLFFIFTAFLLMVAASYYSVNSVMKNQMAESAKSTLSVAESNIKVSLGEPETIVSNAAMSVKRIIEGGGTQDEVRRFFNDTADLLLADIDRWLAYRGIYGVVRGEFIDGTRWAPPRGYDYSAQPWFISASAAKGRAAITMPYPDARGMNSGNAGKTIVSVSREVYGRGSGYLGTVAIDIYLERFFGSIAALSPVEGGYGMIVNGEFNIIAHKDAGLVNKPMAGVSEGFEALAEALAREREISGKTVTDREGVRWTAFFRKMYNGWYVGMLVPLDKFYAPARRSAAGLSALGAMLFVTLGVTLLRVSAEKTRSDEENKSKTGILARMSREIMSKMFLKNRMDDFLSKPIDSTRLYALLRKWLPRSKRQLSEGKSEKSPFAPAREIDGIDLERALENLEGNGELLRQVIRAYIKHTSALLDKIGSPSEENLGEYSIIVHGIKGSSLGLRAGDVASRAGELEIASKNGDIAAVVTKNDDFIRTTRRLISDLSAFLAEEAGDFGGEVKVSPDAELLENIIEASERFDASAIERNLAEMEKYTYENGGELVKWIREQYENLEYDLIRERLTSVRAGLAPETVAESAKK